MPRPDRSPKSAVFLSGYSENGRLVEAIELTYEQFYDGVSALIDSDEYRARRRIIEVRGRIFDSRGVLQEEFENWYTKDGEYSHSRSTFADGTVIEN